MSSANNVTDDTAFGKKHVCARDSVERVMDARIRTKNKQNQTLNLKIVYRVARREKNRSLRRLLKNKINYSQHVSRYK